MRAVILACLVLTVVPVAASAASPHGRYSGSFRFDREFDATENANDEHWRLKRADHWTVTLGQRRFDVHDDNSSIATYDATISGSIDVLYTYTYFDALIYQVTGHWEGSGPVTVEIDEDSTEAGVMVSTLVIKGDGQTGTMGLPGQWTDEHGQTFSDPHIPSLYARIAPGETQARQTRQPSWESESSFRVPSSAEFGHMETPLALQLAYAPPGGADLAVSVDAGGEALTPGSEPLYSITVANLGPGTANAAGVEIVGDDQTVLLGDGDGACQGLARIRCSLATIEPFGERQINVAAVMRYPNSRPPGGSGGIGVLPPGATVARMQRDSADVTATAVSTTPDPDASNNRATSRVAVAADILKPPSLEGVPTGTAAAGGVVWGWYGKNKGRNGGKYLYGLREKRTFQAGGRYGVGAFRVRPRMFIRQQHRNLLGDWRELYVKAEFRLYELLSSGWTGAPEWSVRMLTSVDAPVPDGNLVEGNGRAHTGATGLKPSWRIPGARLRKAAVDYDLGSTVFHLMNANSAYRLAGRFRFYINQGGRDEVYDSKWKFIDAVTTGSGVDGGRR